MTTQPGALAITPAPAAPSVAVVQWKEVFRYLRRYSLVGLAVGTISAIAIFLWLGCCDRVFEAESTMGVVIQEHGLLIADERRQSGLTENSSLQIVNNHLTRLRTRAYYDAVLKAAPEALREKWAKSQPPGTLSSLLIGLGVRSPDRRSDAERFGSRVAAATRLEIIKESHMVRLVARGDTAEEAAMIANLCVESYIAFVEDDAAHTASQAEQQLTERLRETRTRLEASEIEIAEYAKHSDLMEKGEAGDMSLLMTQEVGRALAAVDVKLVHAKQRLNQLNLTLGSGTQVSGITEVDADLQMVELQKQLLEARSREDILMQYCGPRHPSLMRAKNEVERLQSNVEHRLQAQVDAAKSDVAQMEQEKADMKAKLIETRHAAFDMSPKRIRLVQLNEESASLRALHTGLLKQRESARLMAQIRGSAEVRIVDRAQQVTAPVWPKVPLALLASMLTFCFFSLATPVGTGILQDHVMPVVHASGVPERLKAAADRAFASRRGSASTASEGPTSAVPPVAILPRLHAPEGPNQLAEMVHPQGSQVIEQIANITSVLDYNRQRRGTPCVLLITSARGGEGKSLIAALIASFLARFGSKTLLIEGHPAAPQVQTRFPVVQDQHVMPDWSGVEHLRYGRSELFLLTAEYLPSSEAADLGSGYQAIVEHGRRHGMDWIIMDGPPILDQCAEAMPLMPMATDVLLIHNHHRSTPASTAAAMALLRRFVGEAVPCYSVANSHA